MSRKVEKKVKEFLSRWRMFAAECIVEGQKTGTRDVRIGALLLKMNQATEKAVEDIKKRWRDGLPATAPESPREASENDEPNGAGEGDGAAHAEPERQVPNAMGGKDGEE